MTEQKPRAPKGMKCPYFKRDVSKVCHRCGHFVRIYGVNPNARVAGDVGEIIDRWGCAQTWQVMLEIQHMKELNGLGKSIADHNTIAIATSQANAGILTAVQSAFEKLSLRLSEFRLGAIDGPQDAMLIADETGRP